MKAFFRRRAMNGRIPAGRSLIKRGKPKFSPTWLKWLPYNLDIVLPIAALALLSAGALVLTAGKAVDVIGDALHLRVLGQGAAVDVRRIYVDRAEYEQYVPTLMRLNPGVGFAMEAADGGLVLTITSEELFPDLMMALHTMQSFKPAVAWEMTELCARTCPDKAVARVTVKAFKQEIR